MKRIGRRAKFLTVVILYFLACTGVFLYQYAAGASDWVVLHANRNIYRNNTLLCPGFVNTADGVMLFQSGKDGSDYAESSSLRRATLHAVGDPSDRIVTGVVRNYRSNLIGYDLLNGVYNPENDSTSIRLTLDSKVCKAAYDALDDYKGTIGVMNYKTGEIICMVSKPAFDPLDVPYDFSSKSLEGVFINRLTGGLYVPGSIFKLITAAAAIDKIPDIDSQKFICKGKIKFGNDVINCSGTHGTVDFKRALAKSCNCAFAEIATQLGKDVLTEYAQKAGLGKRFDVSGVSTQAGRIDLSKAAQVELAWAGIGQYTTLVNPMQYLIFMSAVANGGTSCLPYYVDSVQTGTNTAQSLKPSGKTEPMISQATATKLSDMMRNNTKVQYEDSRFSGMELCAKTGTAETSDGEPHAWFTGFLRNEKTPFAFVVILEHASSGQGNALPAARSVLRAAVEAAK